MVGTAAVALIVGGLTWVIATAVYAGALNAEYGADLAAADAASTWQIVGGFVTGLGALAFLGSLIAGSIGYDIRYSQSPSPEATADEESA